MVSRAFLLATFVVMTTSTGCLAFLCKWSNEGCDKHEECCSGSCQQMHPGMNARCTKSALHHPCLFSHHCKDRLQCGNDNTCCSKYWDTCRRPIDCCNKDYLCIDVEGFHYRRCLPSPVDSAGMIKPFISLYFAGMIASLVVRA